MTIAGRVSRYRSATVPTPRQTPTLARYSVRSARRTPDGKNTFETGAIASGTQITANAIAGQRRRRMTTATASTTTTPTAMPMAVITDMPAYGEMTLGA